jgi:hypothetical protein
VGDVLPFDIRQRRSSVRAETSRHQQELSDARIALRMAVEHGLDQPGVLAAAAPLIDHCIDRYGFVIMSRGLPVDPAMLSRAVLTLLDALVRVDAGLGSCRPSTNYGVYFGGHALDWFEDGYSGCTGLAVPDDVDAVALAAFIGPRLAKVRA